MQKNTNDGFTTTYPNHYDDLTYTTNSNGSKTDKGGEFVSEIFKIKKDFEQKVVQNNRKSFYALCVNIFSTLCLVIAGKLLISFNIFGVLLLFIAVPMFVISSLYIPILKSFRNIIWYQLCFIGFILAFFSLISSTVFSGSFWVASILLIFLIFVAFLEVENAMILNRIFQFNKVIYQSKKLLTSASLVLVCLGAFFSISALGGKSYIESIVNQDKIYNTLFNPGEKTAIFASLLSLNSADYKEFTGIATQKDPKTYYDLLLKRTLNTTSTKNSFFDAFTAQNAICTDSEVQSNDACQQAFNQFAKVTLSTYSETEFGVNVSGNNTPITLETPMTPANYKLLVRKAIGNYYSQSFESSTGSTNLFGIFSILGKKDSLALLLSVLLFVVISILTIPLNLIIIAFSSLIFQILKRKQIVEITIVKDDIEVLTI